MKKLTVILCLLAVSVCLMGQAQTGITAENRADWFKEAKFGIFVHWGLYSILGGSYNGHTLPDTTMANGKSWYAEWIQQRLEVPADVYRRLEEQFNPVNFDADAWIAEVKNAGARYFVITAKHHDGFALWDSKVSDFDIGNTLYKGELLGDLAKACKKYGIKYGFYYSHWQDWEHPQGAVPHWQPTRPDADFEKYWREKSLPQVRELIERYDPDLFWFDTWNEETHINEVRRDELIAMIRELSPKCLINGRISFYNPGEDIDFIEMFDNAYPDKILEKPWQTPATMVHSWGWHANDFNWKPTQRMLGYLINNTAKGGNYLLNIGPKADGTFPSAAVHRLREMGGWLFANGEAIYGAKPVKIDSIPDGVILTQKQIASGERVVYVGINKQMDEVVLPLGLNKIHKCTVLETGMPVDFVQERDIVRLILPAKLFTDCNIQVIKIE
ncbi:MAG: alpha-L-fucosidase [Prevotellaceae bacterium]|jgi:alpha-L-fucosidase|nr:alpha-L-fucosidase [Prevotellaceae bacterium]